MKDWINDLANASMPIQDKPKEKQYTQVQLVFGADDVNLGKLYNVLKENGFPVEEVFSYTGTDQEDVKPGDMIKTTEPVTAGVNSLMKTQATLYTIPEAVIPEGYIGEVVSVDAKTADIKFDANIDVTAFTNSGNLEKVAYYVGTIKIAKQKIKLL